MDFFKKLDTKVLDIENIIKNYLPEEIGNKKVC